MKWIEGRSSNPNAPYFKMKIFESNLFKFDIYILKYPTGSFISPHIDPCPKGYNHNRVNVIIKKGLGGIFHIRENNVDYPNRRRVIKFRPDIQEHWVSRVILETRYVLSIGWLTSVKE